MTFSNFLAWLTSPDGGAFLLISWAASWGLEGWSWWEKRSANAKKLLILAASAVLGAGAAALQAHPEIVAAIEPILQPVIYIVIAWLGTQTAHKLNTSRQQLSVEMSESIQSVELDLTAAAPVEPIEQKV